ncbi:MAG: hypothetical protein BWY01_01762 [Synergistetes bacterium ADurb.Bin155]|nr:MAG: hypothetical protein BWY01_01762 [Synergistetes bacterium ADurb.Bin155]
MADGIVDRLLDHPEKGKGDLRGELLLDAGLHGDLNPQLPRKPLRQLVQCLGQA